MTKRDTLKTLQNERDKAWQKVLAYKTEHHVEAWPEQRNGTLTVHDVEHARLRGRVNGLDVAMAVLRLHRNHRSGSRVPVDAEISSDWKHVSGRVDGAACDAWIYEDLASGYVRWLIRLADGREYCDGGNFKGPQAFNRAERSLLDALDRDEDGVPAVEYR